MRLFIFVLLLTSLVSGKEIDLSKKLNLQKDLEIGVVEGDTNLMFGDVGNVWIDHKNQILVGDWKMNRIQVFDEKGKFVKSIAFKKGEGPGEVEVFNTFFTIEPDILVVKHAFKPKISIFKIEKNIKFLRDIILDFSPSIRSIAPAKGNKIYIAGLRKDKILHLYDLNGNLVKSFGEPFDVPSKFSKFKQYVSIPWAIDFSNGFLFAFNPHQYELLIFKDEKLYKIIKKTLPFFPLMLTESDAESGIGFFFENPVVLSHANKIYVWKNFYFKNEAFIDIFIDFQYHGTIPAKKWKLKAIDNKGRLYFSEEEEFPKLIRYVLKEK